MTTTATQNEALARDFAAEVREQLADLPQVDLDELLDGLQADLEERLADGGELGDAAEYADELRRAAGLPERGEDDAEATRGSHRPLRERLRERWQAAGQRAAAYWEGTPTRRSIRDFVVSLRPVWWVARGVLFGQLMLTVFLGKGIGVDLDLLSGLVFIGFTIVSVQWGRGRWAPNRWLVALRRLVSVVAVLLVLPTFTLAMQLLAPEPYDPVLTDFSSGLTLDGNEITNIYAYSCDGAPLTGVQLFDASGTPITTRQNDEAPQSVDENPLTGDLNYYRFERNSLASPAGGWNVFPLQRALEDPDTGKLGAAEVAPAPFAKAPALSDSCPVPGTTAGGEAASGAAEDEQARSSSTEPSEPSEPASEAASE